MGLAWIKKNQCFFFGSNLADPTTGLELDQTDFMYNSQVRSVLGKKKKELAHTWPNFCVGSQISA